MERDKARAVADRDDGRARQPFEQKAIKHSLRRLVELLGAVLGEYLKTRSVERSLKGGAGTVAGMVLGAIAKLGIALVMAGLFLFWAWRG